MHYRNHVIVSHRPATTPKHRHRTPAFTLHHSDCPHLERIAHTTTVRPAPRTPHPHTAACPTCRPDPAATEA